LAFLTAAMIVTPERRTGACRAPPAGCWVTGIDWVLYVSLGADRTAQKRGAKKLIILADGLKKAPWSSRSNAISVAGYIILCFSFRACPSCRMPVFIFVITRPCLVVGVFGGLFMGLRRYNFFGGHFTPIVALKPQNGTLWEVKFCFWPRGRQASALRPAWGSALQPGGRESRARPLCAWGVTYLRGCSSAVRSVDRRSTPILILP
jgi:hypothetical protein